jgi:hypothetical protein
MRIFQLPKNSKPYFAVKTEPVTVDKVIVYFTRENPEYVVFCESLFGVIDIDAKMPPIGQHGNYHAYWCLNRYEFMYCLARTMEILEREIRIEQIQKETEIVVCQNKNWAEDGF